MQEWRLKDKVKRSEEDLRLEDRKYERLRTCINRFKIELIELISSMKLPGGFQTQLSLLSLVNQHGTRMEWEIQNQCMEDQFMETIYYLTTSILKAELIDLNTDKPINALG